tara:strand:+ start:285 stop:1193 length:909 start_codon:yes stop_codon:yes gene_type:complete
MRIKQVIPLIVFLLLALPFTSCSGEIKVASNPDKEEEAIEAIFKLPELPDSIEFCGVMLKFDNFDIRERLDKEIIVNTYRHSATFQYLKRANRYFPEIVNSLKAHNIPEDFKYLCVAESGLEQVTSRSGAKGFWQFMPFTAKEYGLIVNPEVDERYNVIKSTEAACKYLSQAQKKFNDWLLTAASYNRGMGGISRDLESQNVDKYFDLHLNTETSRYVFRIIALKIVMENPEKYGFHLSENQLYNPVLTKSIEVDQSIPNLAEWAIEHGSNFRMLKLLNPWILGEKLTFRSRKYIIRLPKDA